VNTSWISPQFCVLGYRPRQEDSAEPKQRHVVLSALFDLDEKDEYKLEILVGPNWRNFVQDRTISRHYSSTLVERAHDDAETLFMQLCSLSVGPITTIECRNKLRYDGHSSAMEYYVETLVRVFSVTNIRVPSL
jgi:hypothetical protein